MSTSLRFQPHRSTFDTGTGPQHIEIDGTDIDFDAEASALAGRHPALGHDGVSAGLPVQHDPRAPGREQTGSTQVHTSPATYPFIHSGGGDDVVLVKAASVQGEGGDDILQTRQGATMFGGFGDDLLIGGSALDQLFGDSGNDRIYGAGGNDAIDGFTGRDIIVGGKGRDFIDAGAYGDWNPGAVAASMSSTGATATTAANRTTETTSAGRTASIACPCRRQRCRAEVSHPESSLFCAWKRTRRRAPGAAAPIIPGCLPTMRTDRAPRRSGPASSPSTSSGARRTWRSTGRTRRSPRWSDRRSGSWSRAPF